MIDLFIDLTTFLTFAGVVSYLYLVFAERRLTLLPRGFVWALTIFCLFGATNQFFQGLALYHASQEHLTAQELMEDMTAFLWVIAMSLKALALNIVAGGALAWGESIKQRTQQIKQKEVQQDRRGVKQDRWDSDHGT